jgi:5-methylcytosine-specific restriction protein A
MEFDGTKMKVKICNSPGCNNLILPTERYCSFHKKEPEKPFSSAIRYNEELYHTLQWRKLRTKILREQPNCFKCGISGSESKLEIHHLIPPRGNEELFFDESNLVSVCPVCHKILTAKEIRDRKRK